MQIDNSKNSALILEELGQRLANHRKGLQFTQATLAAQAGISKRTIERMEKGFSVQMLTMIRVLRVFKLLGALDIVIPDIQALLRKKPKTKRRVKPSTIKKELDELPRKSRSWGFNDQ